LEISFATQEQPKGMAHALLQAENLIKDEFLLTACDSLLTTTNYARLLSSWGSTPKPSAVLSLLPIDLQNAGSTALVLLKNGWVSEIIEKPSPSQFISTISSLPIYIFDKQLFPHLKNARASPRGELELQGAIRGLIDHPGFVQGLFVSGRQNLTSPEDFLEINLQFLQDGQPKVIQEPAQISRNTKLIPPFFIGPRTSISDGCVIGPYVYLESDCTISSRCRISEAILLHGASVGNGISLHRQVIAGAVV
jgi:dTDP-glucose pyrophosphorylase